LSHCQAKHVISYQQSRAGSFLTFMKPEVKPITGIRPEVAESTPLPHTLSVPLRFSEIHFTFYCAPLQQLRACSIFHRSDPSLLDYPNKILRRISDKL